MMQAGNNPLTFLREFARLRQPLVPVLMEGSLRACADADLIMVSPTALALSLSVAEKRRVPICWTALQPTAPSRYLPSFFFPPGPPWLPGVGLYHFLTHAVTAELLWQLMRPTINRARQEILGLPPFPFLGPISATLGKQPHLYGYSPLVVPPPPDWGPHHHVTGYWVLEEPHYQPTAELAKFLAAGPPPVYIGFGSNHNTDPVAVTRLVVRALEDAGLRGLLHAGWGGMAPVEGSDRVLAIHSVPHEWLFGRVAAVVHHGGAGTTGAALRSGVPSLVVPFHSDQPFWGRRTFELGCGPAPIPRNELTAERLAHALRAAVTDAGMQARASRLGRLLRAEDGVGKAALAFEQQVVRESGRRAGGKPRVVLRTA